MRQGDIRTQLVAGSVKMILGRSGAFGKTFVFLGVAIWTSQENIRKQQNMVSKSALALLFDYVGFKLCFIIDFSDPRFSIIS